MLERNNNLYISCMVSFYSYRILPDTRIDKDENIFSVLLQNANREKVSFLKFWILYQSDNPVADRQYVGYHFKVSSRFFFCPRSCVTQNKLKFLSEKVLLIPQASLDYHHYLWKTFKTFRVLFTTRFYFIQPSSKSFWILSYFHSMFL